MNKNKGFFDGVDKPVFGVSAALTIILIIWALVSLDGISELAGKLFAVETSLMASFYVVSATLFLIFCLVLAFSKYGNIRLGKDTDRPEYSTFTWFAMLFSAGMGIGLVFWGAAEPINHFAASPFAESSTAEAASIAMRSSFFHWGLHPWGLYGFMALGIAYFSFRKGMPALLSSAFYPVLGEKGVNGPVGKFIDIVAVMCTVLGVPTSFGLGAMQINTGLNYLYGVPINNTVAFFIVVVIATCFVLSAVTGLKRGIKWLSNTNIAIAVTVLVFFLFFGPSKYLVDTLVETTGSYFQNLIGLSLFVDANGAVADSLGWDWVGGWTIYYWAWWISWVPFVAFFIARISKGRTIREFVMGVLFAPTLFSFIWFSFLGGTAIHQELFQNFPISAAAARDVTAVIFETMGNMSLAGPMTFIVIILIATFFITSADSATFVVCMMTSKGVLEPKMLFKIFWGVVIAAVAYILILAGGLTAVQTLAITVSFPLTVIMLFMVYSFGKGLKDDSDKDYDYHRSDV